MKQYELLNGMHNVKGDNNVFVYGILGTGKE